MADKITALVEHGDALSSVVKLLEATERRRLVLTEWIDDAKKADGALGGELITPIPPENIDKATYTQGRGIKEYFIISSNASRNRDRNSKAEIGFGFKEDGEPFLEIVTWVLSGNQPEDYKVKPVFRDVVDDNVAIVENIAKERLRLIQLANEERLSRIKLTTVPKIEVPQV